MHVLCIYIVCIYLLSLDWYQIVIHTVYNALNDWFSPYFNKFCPFFLLHIFLNIYVCREKHLSIYVHHVELFLLIVNSCACMCVFKYAYYRLNSNYRSYFKSNEISSTFWILLQSFLHSNIPTEIISLIAIFF